MRALALQNANAVISTGNPATTKQLVTNVTFQNTTRPVELDLPSGSNFLWPLRQGQLQLSRTLAPGEAPTSQPVTLTKTTVSVVSRQKQFGQTPTVTISTDSAYLSSINVRTERQQGLAMPVLVETLVYTILVDDDGAT